MNVQRSTFNAYHGTHTRTDRVENQGCLLSDREPALQGTVKKNRNRRTWKDGNVYVSPEHYTFVCRGVNGKERWKRVNAKHLPAVFGEYGWMGSGGGPSRGPSRFPTSSPAGPSMR